MTIIQHLRSTALPLLAGVLAAAPLAAQYPTEPGNGIADLAGIIEPADADSIRAMLNALRAGPGVEVRVLTVQSIARYDSTAATPEAFATAVYNEWKLGYGQAQDGVLVMVSVDDRFARIELGDGVPAHQEARMQAVMDDRMVPRFREGDYSGGVMEGVQGIVESFRGTGGSAAAPDPYASSPQPMGRFSGPQPAYSERSAGGALGIILLAAAVMGAAWMGAAYYRRNRKRSCADCGRRMRRLDETADDVYLDSGRQLEEVLDVADYDVWHCVACGNHQVLAYGNRLSSRQKCPECGYRTMNVTRTVLKRPTSTLRGRERITKNCRYCAWRDEDVITLPRLERRSSSSRSYTSGRGMDGDGGWLDRAAGWLNRDDGWEDGNDERVDGDAGWSRGDGGRSGGGGRQSGGGSSGGSSSGRGASGRW
jgi:uncharacterized protein